MHIFKHLHTINKHRFMVMINCFRCGLIWRGLTHDLSKYSPTEFIPGAKYFQGDRSPTVAERIENGYSKAWMHHKGRNKHHFEYWNDFDMKTQKYTPVEMPRQFLIEMFCDRIAASKVYLKNNYKDDSPLIYFLTRDKHDYMHPNTRRDIEFLLKMLATKGEKETLKYIRTNLKKDSFLAEIK